MPSIDYNKKGIVFDIQRYSIHDGPGIRTIVFLKGCPLSCLWCSNPESQNLKPVVLFDKSKCIDCGKCCHACRSGSINQKHHHENKNTSDCVESSECVAICPTGALTQKGVFSTVEEVIKELKKDTTIYRKSGGGITISGGEPLVQWEFATELLKACQAQGWNTAMETTGYGSNKAVESVFPFVDITLLDIKSSNSDVHKKVTGVTTEKIQQNAVRIAELSQVIVRVPTIPTINAFDEEFVNISHFAKTLKGVDTIHILPYHTYGESKYELLGREYPMGYDIKPLPKEEAEKFKQIVENEGLHCFIGG